MCSFSDGSRIKAENSWHRWKISDKDQFEACLWKEFSALFHECIIISFGLDADIAWSAAYESPQKSFNKGKKSASISVLTSVNCKNLCDGLLKENYQTHFLYVSAL